MSMKTARIEIKCSSVRAVINQLQKRIGIEYKSLWNGCRKINLTKVITTTNQKKGNTWRANENSKYREVNYLKRGNTHLIGWESFASFLNQSQGEVKQN